MFAKAFETRLYIKVFENRFEVTFLSDDTPTFSIKSDEPFTSRRLLVGKFSAAEKALREGIASRAAISFLKRRFSVVIHPVEMTEGGLSEVEDRIFRELAAAVGAVKIVVWVGDKLSIDKANDLLTRA